MTIAQIKSLFFIFDEGRTHVSTLPSALNATPVHVLENGRLQALSVVSGENEMVEVTRRIYLLGGIKGANAYVYLSDEGRVTVVDTGMPGNAERIVKQVKALGKKSVEIDHIVLTHSDLDHSGSAARLKKITKAKIAIYEKDAPSLAGETERKRIKGGLGILFGLMMRFIKFEAVRPDIILADGEEIGGLKVIHCPGHTSGSICLYKPGKTLFAGDALRTDRNGNPKLAPEAMSLDARQALNSARKIAKLEFDVLLPGHGKPISDKAGDKVRKFLDNTG